MGEQNAAYLEKINRAATAIEAACGGAEIAVILGSGLFGIAGLIFAVPVTAVLYRLLADWTNERARQRGVPIIDTVPGVKYDLRGHVRRSFKKKKNNASSGSGRLRTKETKTETGETAAADKAGRTEKSESENSDNK